MIKSCYNKGHHITFKNGVTVSIQYGVGNRCEDLNGNSNARLYSIAELMTQKENGAQAQSVEVSIWVGEDEKNITHVYSGSEDVCDNSYLENVSMEELVNVLIWAKEFQVEG